jgi:hypothetical protein
VTQLGPCGGLVCAGAGGGGSDGEGGWRLGMTLTGGSLLAVRVREGACRVRTLTNRSKNALTN